MRDRSFVCRLRPLLLILSALSWMVLVGFASRPQVLTVCLLGCPFSSIQQAIDAAHWGDIIQILPGIYQEHLQISKSITLEGANADQVILQAPDRKQDVIYAFSFPIPIWVQVSGVLITEGRAGIYVKGMAYVSFTDNIIRDNTTGILLEGLIHAQIMNNLIESNGYRVLDMDFLLQKGGITLRLDCLPELGLRLLSAKIRDNEIVNNIPGIQSFGARVWVENNQITENGVAGIVVYDASWAFIQGNEIRRNWWTGVQVYWNPQVTLLDNVIAENEDQRK